MSAGRDLVYGIHPVEELIRQKKRQVERIWVSRERRGGRFGRLLKEARLAGIPVSYLDPESLARRVGARAAHQGIAARTTEAAYTASSVLRERALAGGGPIVALDGVEDPRNLGAALRTAAAAGAAGVMLAGRSTVGLTATVAKTAAGALDQIPVARESNLGPWLESLREDGFRLAALDPAGGEAWDRADLTGRIIFVAGGEGRGLRPGLLKRADTRLRIPLAAGVESLNVSVALGVVLFEAVRQGRVRRRRGP